jgi:hypothetical protein
MENMVTGLEFDPWEGDGKLVHTYGTTVVGFSQLI